MKRLGMGRGVRVLTIGAIGAVLIGLAGAALIDRAQIQSLQRQVVVLRATAASPARITIRRQEVDAHTTVCEIIDNDSSRAVDIVMKVDGRVSDGRPLRVAGHGETAWCVDS
jgi:hypothetical protein